MRRGENFTKVEYEQQSSITSFVTQLAHEPVIYLSWFYENMNCSILFETQSLFLNIKNGYVAYGSKTLLFVKIEMLHAEYMVCRRFA